MIKGISILRPAATAEEYATLSSFFDALGFEPGKGWDEEKSRGASFLAPMGNLELIEGEMPSAAAVMVEVTQIDAVREASLRWFGNRKVAPEARVSAVAETDWKSRMFTAEPVDGHIFGFWEWSDPLRGKPVAIEGDLSAEGMRFAIVVSRWNSVITDRLLDGALDGLLRSGAARRQIEIVRVPGAWEIPAAARTIAERVASFGGPGTVDAVITLGCLIRGETAHYEAIYNEVSRGIGQSQQETGVPHAFGVLTCETLEQALNRAGIKAGNKGFEAAVAAIEMVSLRRKLLTMNGEDA
ncbi:6,7-dimethyl-8-ribityllumazine synthase [Acidicapsa dinghuensis]|uniref:6,7-dimethyl-8-ribityllumazine synthase n=1 Tax=Acidicapsa dinghuensis TaxID=2218256 RepID=A0ABW1EKR6_9BACT|nr:6,7-dimethyl-8-ribityllumazine synthase [Acidicapsa dinghuensis]